jgi:Holliday junction resolvase RusA-like endonuclease
VTANNLAVNKEKQNWKDLMVFILKELDMIDTMIDNCELIYTTYYPTKRKHDLDNITPKFILDGLVAGGFLTDDNNTCITSLTTQARYDKDNPRIELLFKTF